MSKPKYQAYKPYLATDGLTTQERHYFNWNAEMTDDDDAAFEAALLDMEPETLMAKLQSNLDGLQDITPAIRLHADAIREILARLSNPLTDRTRNRNDEIDRAFDRWRKIIVLRDMLPKAIAGAKNSKVQSNRAKAQVKLTEEQKKRICVHYKKCESEGSVYGEVKALAKEYGVSTRTINTVVKKDHGE